jgi:hypothetical protein
LLESLEVMAGDKPGHPSIAAEPGKPHQDCLIRLRWRPPGNGIGRSSSGSGTTNSSCISTSSTYLSETSRGEKMSATTWKATIRLPNGNQQEVRVMADSQQNARAMLEAQYGRGSI